MISQELDLRTGTPLWLRGGLPRFPDSNQTGIKPDVVVVGTGVSGALVTDALLQAGFTVLAVDRRKIMSGSTPASTALLQGELDTPLVSLEKKIGRAQAARVWLRSAQAVQALVDRVTDLGIACRMTARTSLYLPGNVLDREGLERECKARQRIGLRSSLLSREQLAAYSGVDKCNAIMTRGNAEADPVKLVAGLWRSNIKRGAIVCSDTEVTDVDQSRSSVSVLTKCGRTISARYAVLCTGYETIARVRPRGYKVTSTWVIATHRQKDHLWPSRSLIWEAADPYLYLRTTHDGRIIAGGEDEPFSDDEKRDQLLPEKASRLGRKASRYLPQCNFDPAYSWTGNFGESPNGVPAIGAIKGLPRCFAVLGFGGNGITFSMLAAQLVSRQIQRLPDPDADLFALQGNGC